MGILIGLLTFLWPAIAALVLLYLIAGWAIVTGVLENAAAFSQRLPAAMEGLLGLSGILSVSERQKPLNLNCGSNASSVNMAGGKVVYMERFIAILHALVVFFAGTTRIM